MGKKQLEGFITYMKEKCGIAEPLVVQDTCEGSRQMYKVVLPDTLSDMPKQAWNHFIQEAAEEVKKNPNYQHLTDILIRNDDDVINWNIDSHQVDYYFIYKIHITVIDKFLQEETHEKIMKHCNPEQRGCY